MFRFGRRLRSGDPLAQPLGQCGRPVEPLEDAAKCVHGVVTQTVEFPVELLYQVTVARDIRT